jgi:PAS domain S-box-containing protein
MKVASKTKTDLIKENEDLGRRLKEAEEKLTTYQKNEKGSLTALELARSALDQSTEVIIACDETGKIITATQIAHRFFTNKLVGRFFDSVCPLTLSSPLPFESKQFSISSVLAGKIFRSLEVIHRQNDGTGSYFLLSASPLTNDGREILGSIVTLTDVTERKRAEEALRESEERLRQAHELLEVVTKGTEVIIAAVDTSLRYTFFNKAYEEELKRLTGKDIHIGMSMVEVFAHMPEQQKIAVEEWSQVLRGESTSKTIEFGDPSRHCRFYSVLHTPIRDAEGNVVGAGEVAFDVTEQVRAEEALRKSRDELEIRVQERTKEVGEQSRALYSFFKFSITPFVILDRDFNFIRVNEAYAKACQRDVSEFPGHNHFEFYPSDARGKFEQVVQTKEPFTATARPFTFPDHPEWGTSYWNWTLTPILDKADEVEFLVLSLEDVTERERAEKALKAERQRFNDVLEMLPAYLVLLSPDHYVPFANRFFRERFGESHGKRCFEYLFGRGEPCETCETYTALKTMSPHHWDWTGPDGRNYDVYDFPFTDTDGSSLILEMGIDVTERKRAEEALRESENRLRSLSSQLLSVQENERRRVARELHDGIGQMLTAIKFKVENFIQEKGTGKAKANVKSLEGVIPMIRESMEEARRIQTDLRPSVLDDLGILAALSWLCRNFEATYSHIHIEKQTEIQEEEVSTILKTVIYRISQETLNNVAKHSKADLVRLFLGKSGDRIELRIEDDGKGFDIEKVLSQERDKRGLGLDSMRERAELSGGTFAIESTKGKGAMIKVSWPL